MQIRRAVLEDVPALVAMGRRQMAELFPDWPDAPGQLAILAVQLIESPTGVWFVAEQDGRAIGMIGMTRYRHHVSGVVTAGEVAWFMEPDVRGAGVALLQRAERWACEMGAAQIQMMAPNERVGRLYQRRGYAPIETTYQRAVAPSMTAITVHDDVLPDAAAYAAATRQQSFRDVQASPGTVFHGIADAVDDRLSAWIVRRYPQLQPTLSFVRQSPAGQNEPNYIHTDRDMGEWTALYYLTEQPPAEDGTAFWRNTDTGAICSLAETDDECVSEQAMWPDLSRWERWHTVPACLNRLVLFPASYFHSRALPENYGTGDTARLLQVVFGTGRV